MKVTSRDHKLAAYISNYNKAVKELGLKRAKALQKRIAQLTDVDNLEGTRYLPGHYHELVDNRKGQWACDLDQPYRLIFEPHESPIPTDSDGKYIWIEIKGVELIEVTNYHGK